MTDQTDQNQNEPTSTPEEIQKLKDERLRIHRQIKRREGTLKGLDNEVTQKTSTIDGLNEQITNLTNQKNEIEALINENNPKKETLEGEVSTLTENKTNLTTEIGELNTTKKNLNTDIAQLQKDKTGLEQNVKVWKEKNNLYTNDLAGISTDNKGQRVKYARSAIFSFLGAAALMVLLICTIRKDIEIPEAIKETFSGNVGYIFYLLILFRISLIAAIFIIIFVFINLTRGFVSQFIRTQEKMFAIRLINFLVSKVGKDHASVPEGQKMNYETQRIAKQNELLNQHLPDLFEYNPTSFDKLSKTKGLEERIENILKKKDGEE